MPMSDLSRAPAIPGAVPPSAAAEPQHPSTFAPATFVRYRSIHVQNLAQSAISAATFGAANSLLLPIGVPFLLGRPDLIIPMLVGAALSMLLDAYLLYR